MAEERLANQVGLLDVRGKGQGDHGLVPAPEVRPVTAPSDGAAVS